MTSRREFIQLSGMGMMATAAPSFLKTPLYMGSHHFSIQLYTIRDAISKDLKGSLKRLADIGFKNVETAFWPKDVSDELAANTLNELGLKVSSCHVDIPTKENIAKLVKNAKAYNCKNIIWHGWPEDKRYSSLEGTRQLVKIYNESNKLAKDNGLHFGLHNHWWEYRNNVGGRLVYDVLNEELAEDIFFETDTYWVKVAGQDPVNILEKLKNRIQFIHLKDGPAVFNEKLIKDEPDPMTPLGKGTLNIPGIINACSPKVRYVVLELDKSAIDVFDAIQQSMNYISKFKTVSTQ